MKIKKGSKVLLSLCILILLLFLYFILSNVFASEKTVSVSTLYGYPPYCFIKGNAEKELKEVISKGSDSPEFQGYSWDVIRESLHQMGYIINLNVMSWSSAMDKVKDGTVEIIFPAGKNAEREKIFLYSQEPVNEAEFLVYVRKDSDIKWEGLKSLNGLTIGVMKDFNYGDRWKAQISIKKHEVNDIIEGFKMLDYKEIDGFAGYEDSWDYAIKQEGWKENFKKLPVFDSTAEYLAGLKSNKQVPKILEDFDTGKKQIIKNGKFEEIVKKWH